MLANRSALLPGEGYYSIDNYASWNIVMGYPWKTKLLVVAWNLLYGVIGLGELWGIGPRSLIALVPAVGAGGVIARGLWRNRLNPLGLCTAAYLLIVISWAWRPTRFLIPILPLLLWLFVDGASRRRMAAVCATAALAVTGVVQAEKVSRATQRSGTAWPSAGAQDDCGEMRSLFDWIRRETPEDAVLTGNLDPLYYLFTGRISVRAFTIDPLQLYYTLKREPIGTTEDLRQRLMETKASYLVMSPGVHFPMSGHLARNVRGLFDTEPDSLTPVSIGRQPGYVVYRINRQRLAPNAARR